MDIEVLIPDINESDRLFSPIKPKRIRFGLAAVKNVGENIVTEILRERQEHGVYKSVQELLERIDHKDLNKKSIEALIKAGAFDSLADRGTLLSNLEELLRYAQDFRKNRHSMQDSLFGGATLLKPLTLQTAVAEMKNPLNYLKWEKELLGLYITGHPLHEWKSKINNNDSSAIMDIRRVLKEKPAGLFKTFGIVSTVKRIMTKTGQMMMFAKIEGENGGLEAVIFPRTLEKTANLWQTDNILMLEGKLSWKDQEPKLICENAWELK